MLKDEDRIFQNLYNDFGAELDSAKKRGDWIETKEIFNKHSNLSGEKFSYNKDTNLDGILKGTSNELEKTALLANQEMKKIREYLDNDINCKYERMTGSGSAYFTVYEDKQKAEEAIQRISEEHPNWWTYLTRLI